MFPPHAASGNTIISPAVPRPVYRPLNERFGERLRTLRRAKNMTQTQLAVHLGIDRSFISDVERGRKGMSLSLLDVVAQGFEITLSDLLVNL